MTACVRGERLALRLAFFLPVLQRLRAGLNAFEVGVDAVRPIRYA